MNKKEYIIIGEARCMHCDCRSFRLVTAMDRQDFTLICEECGANDHGWRPPDDHPVAKKKTEKEIVFGFLRGTA